MFAIVDSASLLTAVCNISLSISKNVFLSAIISDAFIFAIACSIFLSIIDSCTSSSTANNNMSPFVRA